MGRGSPSSLPSEVGRRIPHNADTQGELAQTFNLILKLFIGHALVIVNNVMDEMPLPKGRNTHVLILPDLLSDSWSGVLPQAGKVVPLHGFSAF